MRIRDALADWMASPNDLGCAKDAVAMLADLVHEADEEVDWLENYWLVDHPDDVDSWLERAKRIALSGDLRVFACIANNPAADIDEMNDALTELIEAWFTRELSAHISKPIQAQTSSGR